VVSLSHYLFPCEEARRFDGASFQLNPPYWVGEIIFDGVIPFGDEIRLDAGWVDLISSA